MVPIITSKFSNNNVKFWLDKSEFASFISVILDSVSILLNQGDRSRESVVMAVRN